MKKPNKLTSKQFYEFTYLCVIYVLTINYLIRKTLFSSPKNTKLTKQYRNKLLFFIATVILM